MWARENEFNDIVRRASERYGVPVPLIKAIIGKESSFNPRAFNPGDPSRGLMQVTDYTARLYRVDPATLYDPDVNVMLGTRIYRDFYDQLGRSTPRALSAYNGGARAEAALGTVAPHDNFPVRRKDGTITYVAKGKFLNQAYVDTVLRYMQYFAEQAAPSTPVTPPPTPPGGPLPGDPASGLSGSAIVLLLGGLIALLGLGFTLRGAR